MKTNKAINRRNFILQSSALLTASVLAPNISLAKRSKYKMGLQLYTIRDAMERDLKVTLKQVASLGYQDLETYGYDPEAVKYYGLHAADFRQLLTDHNLTTSSGHYDLFLYLNKSLEELERYVDRCIEGAHALGQGRG